jgi:glutamyl-tRNA synthetase
MKEEDGSKRKLSKRKDPEAAVDFFVEEGYPAEAVVEYLLTIANSNFEDWRKQNKTAHYNEFPFKLNKMSASGALFDMMKLNSVSAEVISRMSAEQVYDLVIDWAKNQDAALYGLLAANPDYAKALFAIDRGGKKPRKDIVKWTDVAGYAAYFYDELFTRDEELEMDKDLQKQVLEAYQPLMNCADDKDTWFGKMKDICEPLGMSPDVKAYKAAPEQFKGHVGDVSAVVRMAICGRKNTPDLHAIMALLGQDKCLRRLKDYMTELEGKPACTNAIPGHTGFVIK